MFELELHYEKKITQADTLIIFDEIQECGRALIALKYFCENAPEYHIVCAGSLLGIALQKQLSFPVGKVDFLTLYPMSFSEFLRANDAANLADFVKSAQPNGKLPEIAANKLESYLRQYYITGGMPEVVKSWSVEKDIEVVEQIQQNIID